MAKIKHDAKKQPVVDKKTFADTIATKALTSPVAGTLTTELTALAAAATAMNTALNEQLVAQQTAEEKTALLLAAEEAFDAALDDLINEAEDACNGDAGNILSLGLTPYVPGDGGSVPAFTAPTNLSASFGDFAGSVDLHWDKVKGARSYFIQYTTTPNDAASWVSGGASSKSSHTVTGLTSGTKYYFRVAAFGAQGQGPWSPEENKLAP